MGSKSRFFSIWAIVFLVLLTILAGCNRSATKEEPTASPAKEQEVGKTPEQTMSTPKPTVAALTPVESTKVVETPQTQEPTVTPEPVVEATTVILPTEPAAEVTPATEQTYVISVGDTLFSIALAHNVTVEELAARNGITDVNSIEVGQEIIIPVPAGEETTAVAEETGTPTTTETGEGVHVVQPGENLFRIALKYNLSFETVAAYNNIPWPYYIYPGQEILIPPE